MEMFLLAFLAPPWSHLHIMKLKTNPSTRTGTWYVLNSYAEYCSLITKRADFRLYFLDKYLLLYTS
jgi:hypothetical protein